jgi:glycosyltransferase involved in cell wall biosynthesis
MTTAHLQPSARNLAPRRARRRVVVVGNGPTGVALNGDVHVDLTGGSFLLDLAASGWDVLFLQPLEPLELSLNYYGCVLPPDRVTAVALDNRSLRSTLISSLSGLRAVMRADFVYLFFPGTLPRMVARLCRLLRKPVGIYLRGTQFQRGGADASLLRRARFVLAASRGLADQVRALGAKVRLIRPMLDLSAADTFQRDHRTPRQGPVRLLFVGRIERSKGVPELLEAVASLRAKGLAVELKLVGWGDLHSSLAELYPPGAGSGIELAGAIEDRDELMRHYESADIFVLPTHHEGFPRVLYEAMIKSAVIVTTMVGGIPGLMKHEENCLAVPVGDAAAISAAIERLAADPGLRQGLAKAAHRSALEVLEGLPPHAQALSEELESALSGSA